MLSIDNLHSGYGEIEVLHGVNMVVNAGEIVTIIGANGAGKTTLAKTISGLIRPRSGAITFDGDEIHRRPAHKIVRLGVVHAPEGRAVLRRMTVRENLLMGAYTRSDSEVRSDLESVFARYPLLRERASQPADVLSGGERQMLAIARALMARAKLLLLDEPSLGLAPMVVEDVFATIKKLRDDGLTILLVEQNARRALQLADRGYVLERGNVVLQGTGDELLRSPDVQRTYLGAGSSKRQRSSASA
jgi:branched-chain amino acid transport system ATP-binding protein